MKDQLRDTDRQLRRTGRDLERDRREIERDEKKLEMEIKNAAKMGNKQVCTILAKQLVQLRKQKERSYAANSKITALNSQTKVMGANVKLAGAMTTATKSLASMNKVMNPEKIGQTMQEFEKATSKMDMTEEMMNDALDDILNESGDEEEGESIVQQVLDEIGIDVSAKISQAPSAPARLGESSKSNTDIDDIERQLAKLKS